MPTAQHLRRREHAAATAHVAERRLARAMRTAAANARNTRNRTSRAPRFGRRLMA